MKISIKYSFSRIIFKGIIKCQGKRKQKRTIQEKIEIKLFILNNIKIRMYIIVKKNLQKSEISEVVNLIA